ncbi:hypothetical protein V8E53_013420 [Lactarius tabidus]
MDSMLKRDPNHCPDPDYDRTTSSTLQSTKHNDHPFMGRTWRLMGGPLPDLVSAHSCRTVCGSYAPTAGSLHVASASTSPWPPPPPASSPSPPPSAPPAPQQERGRRQRDHLAAYTPLLSFSASKRAAPGFVPRTPPLLSHSPPPPPPAPPVARTKGGLDSEITSLSIPPFSPSPRRANERRPVSHNSRRPLLSTSPSPLPSAPPAPQQKRGKRTAPSPLLSISPSLPPSLPPSAPPAL